MSFGGYHSYPRRFGGGKPRVQVIHESLNAQRGTALDTTISTNVCWIENLALARALDAAWSVNARLGHQWDPNRTTDMLPRWERIMRLVVPNGTTDVERRQTLAAHWARFGALVNIGRLSSKLSTLLGDVFVALEFIGYDNAVIHVPDGSYPWGDVVSGAPWYSTTMHMLVRTQVPTGYSEEDYLAAVGPVFPILDGVLPSWMTWTVYRPGPVNYDVTDGPSAGGFYLDTPHNLGPNGAVFGS